MRAHVPFVISPDNPFALDLTTQRVPFLLHGDDLDARLVGETRARLTELAWSEIAFTADNCVSGWRHAPDRRAPGRVLRTAPAGASRPARMSPGPHG